MRPTPAARLRTIVEQQPFASGSIDRLWLQRQVLLTPETRSLLYGSVPEACAVFGRPRLQAVLDGVAPERKQPLAKLLALTRWCHRIPLDFPDPDGSTIRGFYGDFSAYQWGGSEEQIIAKGSPWPQELARVLIALLRQAGLPARMVFLYRSQPAGLHAVVEAWVSASWVVCDPCANRLYAWPHHGYAAAADLQAQPRLVDQQPEHGRNPYVDSAFYETVAIAGHRPEPVNSAAYAPQKARHCDGPPLLAAAGVFAA